MNLKENIQVHSPSKWEREESQDQEREKYYPQH